MTWICITGSSKGLGEQLAYAFARNGFDIILHGRDKVRCNVVADNVKNLGVKYRVVVGDIKNNLTISRLVLCIKNVGASILINNVGTLSTHEKFNEVGDAELHSMIETNLIYPMILTKHVYKELDVIININSRCGIVPSENHVVYSASKMGLRGFSDALTDEYPNLHILDVYAGRIDDYKKVADAIMNRYTLEVECGEC